MAQYTFDGQTVITKPVAANDGVEDTDIQDHGGKSTDEQIIVTVEIASPSAGDHVDVYPLWSVGDLKADPDAGPPTMTTPEHTVPVKFSLWVDNAAASPCTRAIPVPNGMKFSGLRFINRSGANVANVWAERGS